MLLINDKSFFWESINDKSIDQEYSLPHKAFLVYFMEDRLIRGREIIIIPINISPTPFIL